MVLEVQNKSIDTWEQVAQEISSLKQSITTEQGIVDGVQQNCNLAVKWTNDNLIKLQGMVKESLSTTEVVTNTNSSEMVLGEIPKIVDEVKIMTYNESLIDLQSNDQSLKLLLQDSEFSKQTIDGVSQEELLNTVTNVQLVFQNFFTRGFDQFELPNTISASLKARLSGAFTYRAIKNYIKNAPKESTKNTGTDKSQSAVSSSVASFKNQVDNIKDQANSLGLGMIQRSLELLNDKDGLMQDLLNVKDVLVDHNVSLGDLDQYEVFSNPNSIDAFITAIRGKNTEQLVAYTSSLKKINGVAVQSYNDLVIKRWNTMKFGTNGKQVIDEMKKTEDMEKAILSGMNGQITTKGFTAALKEGVNGMKEFMKPLEEFGLKFDNNWINNWIKSLQDFFTKFPAARVFIIKATGIDPIVVLKDLEIQGLRPEQMKQFTAMIDGYNAGNKIIFGQKIIGTETLTDDEINIKSKNDEKWSGVVSGLDESKLKLLSQVDYDSLKQGLSKGTMGRQIIEMICDDTEQQKYLTKDVKDVTVLNETAVKNDSSLLVDKFIGYNSGELLLKPLDKYIAADKYVGGVYAYYLNGDDGFTYIDIWNSKKKEGIKNKTPEQPAKGKILGDLTSKASEYPDQAWAKNNNPAGITWSENFLNPKEGDTAYIYQQAGIKFEKGTLRPAKEGLNYVKFATIEDGLKAQQLLMTEKYGDSTVDSMLQSWVGTLEGPSYAKTIASDAGISLHVKVDELTQEQLERLQMSKIKKESGGLYNLLTKEDYSLIASVYNNPLYKNQDIA